jgi:hypothetical protein
VSDGRRRPSFHSSAWSLRGVSALASALVVCVGAIASAGCGKVGPPLPPITRVAARPGPLVAVQVGDSIRLSWSAPNLDLREKEGSSIQRADVLRLRQLRDTGPITAPDEFEESSDVAGYLSYDTLKQQLTGSDRLVYEDRLDLAQPATLSNTRFQYAVRFVDRRGRQLPLSNIVAIEPVPGIAKPPSSLAFGESQDRVVITWTPPTENIDGTPAQVVGFNVYRAKPNAERFGRPLNDKPLSEPRFEDVNFLYLTPYVYVVRSVSQGPESQVESVDSERLTVTPRDAFPPSAPQSLTVASAGGAVSLFWPSNSERDVVGYNVYRAEGDGGASAQWVRLTQSVLPRTTFKDDRVRVGTRYSYRITAMDRYGNESRPSDVASDTASP